MPESPARLRITAVAAGVVAGTGFWALADQNGGSLRPWLVVVIAVAGCLVIAEVLSLGYAWRAGLAARGVPPAAERTTRTDRERGGLARAERRLARSMADADTFGYSLRPWLRSLTEHRLRTHHGIDSTSDPTRARELVGDELWQLLTQPTVHLPDTRRLAELVRTIERL